MVSPCFHGVVSIINNDCWNYFRHRYSLLLIHIDNQITEAIKSNETPLNPNIQTLDSNQILQEYFPRF